MRTLLGIVGLLFIGLISFGQNGADDEIRFQHIGPADKHIKQVVITTHKITTLPGDERLITRKANYNDLCQAIAQCKYLALTKAATVYYKPFYKVTVNGRSFLLDEGNAFMFFRKLTILMKKKPADADIAQRLDYINTRIGR